MIRKLAAVLSISVVLIAMSMCLGASRAVAQQPHGAATMHRGGARSPHIFAPKGSFKNQTKNLIDHGGLVLQSSDVYVVYWGSFSSSSDIPSAMQTFFEGYGGSSYANILSQYMNPVEVPAESYQGAVSDPTNPPRRGPSVNTIVDEACSTLVPEIGHGIANPAGVYFVITSNFPKGGNYCAWHSYGTCNGTKIAVVYLPNVTGVSGCDIGGTNSNPYSSAAQSMANIAAHELSESITDPLLNAWYDSSGQEVGDKCAWQFGSPVQLTYGITWQLQEEWSNSASGCIQSL